MKESPLKSLEAYSRFVAQVFDRSEVARSTLPFLLQEIIGLGQ